jgi:hypothetical protein
MADYVGSVQLGVGDPFDYPGRVSATYGKPAVGGAAFANNLGFDDVPATEGTFGQYTNEVVTPPIEDFVGCKEERTTFAFDYFEKFHVTPASFILGNVLATQQISVVVYSAYRTEQHTWDAFVNNAGAGVELLNQPTLPYTFEPQEGLTNLILQVGTSGPPTVDTTLDFVFDTMTISPVIQLERIVFWSPRPNMPYRETLEFNTQIIEHSDGSEQRIALRPNPRQQFDWTFLFEPGTERARIHNLLFDWQSRVYGIPMYHEATFTTSAITAGDTVINVQSTDYADYREAGLAIVYDLNAGTNDIVEIDTGGIASTTLTLTTGTVNSYSSGVLVAPIRTAKTRPSLSGQRYTTDAATLKVPFEVLDNESNLASTAAWTTTHNSKVVVDDENAVSGSMQETFQRNIIVLDNGISSVYHDSPTEKGKRGSVKRFHATSKQDVWEVRQLIHALRGRQVSFYLPTFGYDLTPAAQLLSGGTALTVVNVGYDKYVKDRRPYTVIRVHFTDSVTNPPLIRTITASSEIDADTETLTVDSAWPATYQPEDVDRIEYLELVRFDSDSFRFSYEQGDLTVRITCPVITVFD